jgi:hypothetical protein
MSAMSSAPVITRHLDYLRAAGLATTTITAREGVLRRLAAHLGDVPLLYATHDDLVAWQASRTRGAGNATRHAELCHARQFYRWAVAERLIAADPTARLALPRIPRRMPRPMRDVTLADAIGRAGPVDAAILGLAAPSFPARTAQPATTPRTRSVSAPPATSTRSASRRRCTRPGTDSRRPPTRHAETSAPCRT